MKFIHLNLVVALVASLVALSASEDDGNVESANTVECVTNNGDEGVCVKYHSCNINPKSIIEDGYSVIKAREENACQKFLDVCCARSQIKTVNDADRGNVESSSSNSQRKCGVVNPSVNIFKARDGDTSDRVYADLGEFPWMVAVLERNQNENAGKFINEGSLIHPSVVLTVAHKLLQKNPEELKVRAGEWDSKSIDEEFEYQERDVAKVLLHNNFNPAESRNGLFRQATTKLHNNAVLLILQEPVSFVNAPHIGLGCLAPQLPDAGTSCFTIGWGAENFNNKNVFAPIIKKIKLPLVSEDDCVRTVRVGCLGAPFHLHQSHVCAGGEPEFSSCLGDGGSFLVCPVDNEGARLAIVGMVSHQVNCVGANVSCIYVNVPSIYGWVMEQMSAESLDSSSFVYN